MKPIRAKKNLGQHFLTDLNIARRIVETLDFTNYKRVLEIGVGAGSDHLNWAKAGVDLFGVDLTEKGIETTRKRLNLYGLKSNLQRIDAESLPFDDNYFDIVYCYNDNRYEYDSQLDIYL